MPTILVTGATGNVGAEIIKLLRDTDHRVLAAARDPSDPSGDRLIERVRFDFADPATFAPALKGVDRLFLLRPPQLADVKRYFVPLIDAARREGVDQIVLLSLLGAEKNPVVPHRKIEDAILHAGVPYTFLRPSFFMQNLSTTHRADIQHHNEIFVPAGSGPTSFIDVRDIAAVAAKTLTEDGHVHQAYPLTGNAALTYLEVADIFTDVLGRPIVYRNPSIFEFVKRWQFRGEPLSYILVMTAIYTTARLGLAGAITPDTERLLGRPPITMRQFVEDYCDVWT